MYEIGDALAFSASLYDKNPDTDPTAALINATAVVFTLTQPDGTVVPGTTVPASASPVGKYVYTLATTAQAGLYRGRWLFTLPVSGAITAYTQEFDVQPLDPGLIISLDRVKKQLGITSTKEDEELRTWMAATTRVIEMLVGAIRTQTIVERVSQNNYSSRILLRRTPVQSVVSILPWATYGITYPIANVRVSPDGWVETKSGMPFRGGPFEITYIVGQNPVGPHIIQAHSLIIKHLWETRRGPGRIPSSGGNELVTVPGFGYAIPSRALELLGTDQLGPSVS